MMSIASVNKIAIVACLVFEHEIRPLGKICKILAEICRIRWVTKSMAPFFDDPFAIVYKKTLAIGWQREFKEIITYGFKDVVFTEHWRALIRSRMKGV